MKKDQRIKDTIFLKYQKEVGKETNLTGMKLARGPGPTVQNA